MIKKSGSTTYNPTPNPNIKKRSNKMSDKIKKNNLKGTGESGTVTYRLISSNFSNETSKVNNNQIKKTEETKVITREMETCNIEQSFIKKDNKTEKD